MVEVMGEIMAPADISEETALYNEETLTEMLNAGNCFDVEMKPRAKDVLELHFSCQDSYLVYSFVFKKKKWEITENDPFGNGLKEKLSGKIKQPSILK